MPGRDCIESRNTPHLLSLLLASIEQATQAGTGGGGGIPPKGGRSAAATCSSSLRIRELRRAYNIILFGGPSHAEIIAQAALEDNSHNYSSSDNSSCSTYADDSGSSYDSISFVSASVSAISLELRRARRYDPANALEVLVDDLLASSRRGEGQQENTDGCSSSVAAGVMRLLLALRGEGRQAWDADDWELLGGHARRVLERLYSSSSSGGELRRSGQQENREIATTASLPVAMFFRDGQGRSNKDFRPSYQRPEAVDMGPRVAEVAGTVVAEAGRARTATPVAAQRHHLHRYLLPNDCALHGDSTTTVNATTKNRDTGAVECIPWFTNAEFASERGIPDISKGSCSLDECIGAMTTAPLSPAAWTRIYDNAAAAGDNKVVARSSGGEPAAPVTGAGDRGDSGGRKLDRAEHVAAARQGARRRTRDGAPWVHGGLDLCGALSQAKVDARSPVVRELRLALSIPDLVEGHPPELLEAALLHQPLGPPRDCLAGDGCNDSLEGVLRRDFSVGKATKIYATPVFAVRQSPRRVASSPNGSRASPLFPIEESVPSWANGSKGCLGGGGIGACPRGVAHDFSGREFVALELEPVGWERTEADWNDPSFPKWALACAPLATGEGGRTGSNVAFELCYREHFGWTGLGGYLGEDIPATTEGEVIRRALAVLQGVPSAYFWYDENHARMRVCGYGGDERTDEEVSLMPPRVTGLSPGALSSLLKDFARAGTWYRRVQEFVDFLMNRASAAGQVAHAFGTELRRQLTAIQSALIGISTEFAGLGRNDCDSCYGGMRDTPIAKAGCCSLTGVLVRTTQLRRAAGGLAEICGLFEDDLGTSGGVNAVFRAFPRGASLLTYLYNVAEVRVASNPGVGDNGHGTFLCGNVMGEKDSALALLGSAAVPYLAMLSRWLWSGELRAEDDPCKEFPLRCRERLAGGACPTNYSGDGNSRVAKEPWMEDGGSSFMTVAFIENEAADVPAFLGSGLLATAAEAGKLLRMLKLSSPGFYTACSASPPPPLSLVFGSRALASRVAVFERLRGLRAAAGQSAMREVRTRAAEKKVREGMASGGRNEQLLAEERSALGKLELQRERDNASVEEARRIWIQGLDEDRDAAAAAKGATATENSSPAAAYTGQGVLSFLDPPTSEAEAFASAAITERYRVLGEKADARAARARWKRRRSARLVAARASLKMLYADEMQLWKGMAAEAGPGAVRHVTAEIGAMVNCTADDILRGVAVTSVAAISGVPDRGGGGDGGGQIGYVTEHAVVEGEVTVDGDRGGVEVRVEEAVDAIERACGSEDAGIPDKHSEVVDMKFSRVHIVEEPGGKSTGMSAALGSAVDEARGVKFSHVNIVQEPGGKSSGVSAALGVGIDGGDDHAITIDSLPGRAGLRKIVQEPGGSSSAVARTLSHGSSGGVDRVSRSRGEELEDHEERDGNSSEDLLRAAIQISGESAIGPSPATEQGAAVAVGAAGVGAGCHSRTRNTLKNAPSSGDQTDFVPSAETRLKSLEGAGEESAGRKLETERKRHPNRSWSLSGDSEGRVENGLEMSTDRDASLPLEAIVRRCVTEHVVAQCNAVDSAALAFLVRNAGVAEHLASLRTFLLGLTSDFLHDFSLRLLDGLYNGVDWRRFSNLDAAFAASASATGLDSVPLAETFRYEVDPTCGGVLGSGSGTGYSGLGSRMGSSGCGGGAAHSVNARSSSPLFEEQPDLYSPIALSFVSPVLEVRWPVGVLLPKGVLHTYAGIHRSLFRHQLALQRLRRLRIALRQLDACVDARTGVGVGDRVWSGDRRRRRGGGSSSRQGRGVGVSWDRGRIHWLHLFRHEMQHMADSLQTFFAEQAEVGWPDLRQSLSAAGGGAARGEGGGLAALAAAHSCYISKMNHHMFLGTDRQGAVARGRIGEFYEVICSVGRITDRLVLSTSLSSSTDDVGSGARTGSAGGEADNPSARGTSSSSSSSTGEMILPDEAFAELAAAREKFDASRRGVCGALSEICAAGGGARARPLLAVIGYGGYEGDDVVSTAWTR